MIKEVDGEWCLLTADGKETISCHPTEEKAKAQERAVQAAKHAMAVRAGAVLPAKQFAQGLSDEEVTHGEKTLAAAVKHFEFDEGMCEKFGPEDGMMSRCKSAMEGKEGIDDPAAFCAAMHEWCTGKWPAEKANQLPGAVKSFLAVIAASAPHEVHGPMHKMFDELLAQNETRDALNKIFWALQDSVSSIMADGTMDMAQRQKMLSSTLSQFLAALKKEVPNISLESYKAATSIVVAYKKKADDEELYELKDVEIFATGKHNGDNYTEKDLDDIVEAYKGAGYSPPLKAGHDETPGKPALGWLENVRRVGQTLFADITHIPKEVYSLIKKRGYDRVSAEIYWNLKSGGKTFRRALKAVALLGAEVPAVTSLAPLHTLFSGHTGEVKFYDSTTGGSTMDKELEKQLAALTKQLGELQAKMSGDGGGGNEENAKLLSNLQTEVKKLSQRIAESGDVQTKLLETESELEKSNKRIADLEERDRQGRIGEVIKEVKIPAFRPYLQAMLDAASREEKTVKFKKAGDSKESDRTLESVVKDFIGELNKAAGHLFKTHSGQKPIRGMDGTEGAYDDPQWVSNEVDKRAKAHQASKNIKDYGVALQLVLDEDPELKAAYQSS